MSYVTGVLLFVIGLFVGMLILLETGRRIAITRKQLDPESPPGGFGAIDGAVYGLMGLLIAFTFSGAAARFEARRHLIIEETNAIGTAYLRLDLLPAAAQPALREDFRRYLDARLEAYRKIPDLPAVRVELARANVLQAKIWAAAVAAAREEGHSDTMSLVVPALNQMIDITRTRTAAFENHPPIIIFWMLAALMLASSLLAGYGMAGPRRRSWIHFVGFALVMAASVYVIIDLEFPRMGLIRIDPADRLLMELRDRMK